jgi:succinate dehydrogenase/fumarate reductase flavoprotein subunit
VASLKPWSPTAIDIERREQGSDTMARLGCNSLLDIVVFGRAAALRCAEKLTAKASQPELPPDAREETLARFDRLRNAKGGTPTSTLRLQMQHAMQSYASVFRTESILQEGKEALREVWNGLSDIAVSDRSMIWNSDLVESLDSDEGRAPVGQPAQLQNFRPDDHGVSAKQ